MSASKSSEPCQNRVSLGCVHYGILLHSTVMQLRIGGSDHSLRVVCFSHHPERRQAHSHHRLPFLERGKGGQLFARPLCTAVRASAGGAVGAHGNQPLKAFSAAPAEVHIDGHAQFSLAPASMEASVPCCVSCCSKISRVMWQASRIRASASE